MPIITETSCTNCVLCPLHANEGQVVYFWPRWFHKNALVLLLVCLATFPAAIWAKSPAAHAIPGHQKVVKTAVTHVFRPHQEHRLAYIGLFCSFFAPHDCQNLPANSMFCMRGNRLLVLVTVKSFVPGRLVVTLKRDLLALAVLETIGQSAGLVRGGA